MNEQPKWKLIAQLGDVHPIDHGGYFVFVDTTGIYAPEGELLEPPLETSSGSSGNEIWTVYRFILDPCTYQNGILSDNKYHPNHPAWFADKIDDVARFVGMSTIDLLVWFTGNEIAKRAMAYRAVGEYYGFNNLDQYPLTLTRAEVEARYSDNKYKL